LCLTLSILCLISAGHVLHRPTPVADRAFPNNLLTRSRSSESSGMQFRRSFRYRTLTSVAASNRFCGPIKAHPTSQYPINLARAAQSGAIHLFDPAQSDLVHHSSFQHRHKTNQSACATTTPTATAAATQRWYSNSFARKDR
jgi:hypothetical protein